METPKIHIHSDECNCSELDDFTKRINTEKYAFNFKCITHIAVAHPCLDNSERSSAVSILDDAVRILKERDGDKTDPIFKEVFAIRSSEFSSYFSDDEVVELIARGGWGRDYYVRHDKNSNFAKKNKKNK